MSTTFFPCEACILTCGPCPSPLKINGHKYSRMGCSGGVFGIVETLISLDVYLIAGAYPATGITFIQANLAFLGSPTVIATTLGMTVGTRFYRPVSGTGCENTLGTMYVYYDTNVHVIHSFSVTQTFPATGSIVYTVYMSDNPGYGCMPCTNQAGFIAHKIGVAEGYNTVNLAPSQTGAIGDACAPSGGPSVRVTGVAEWVSGACCPAFGGPAGYGIVIDSSCAASATAGAVYKDGSLCNSYSERPSYSCSLAASPYGVPNIVLPNTYSVSGTGTATLPQGTASVSLTFSKTSCGTTTVVGTVAGSVGAPLGSGFAYTQNDTVSLIFYIDMDNPCYRIKVTCDVSGSYQRTSSEMHGYNLGMPSCDLGYARYDVSSCGISVTSIGYEVVAL